MDMNAASEHDDLPRAALLGVFDPRDLIPDEAPDCDARLAALAAAAVEKELAGEWLWSLTADARRAGLALLPEAQAGREALLAGLPVREGDTLGPAFRTALAAHPGRALGALLASRGARVAPSLAAVDLMALFQAVELLDEAGVALPGWAGRPGAARSLQRAIVLDRRETASRRLLPQRFRGRTRELAALRAFARGGGGAGAGAIPAMVVTGMGGAGKSALVEALRRGLARDPSVILVSFDLDQTALRSGERAALTLELLRQIGFADPDLDEGLSGLRAMLRGALPMVSMAKVETAGSAVYAALTELGRLLDGAGQAGRAFVVIFDTFEEALVAGAGRVRLIADWLAMLRDVTGGREVRAILLGRAAESVSQADLPDLAVAGRIELGDLGARAGQGKLRDMFADHGVPHDDLAPDLIAAFGSNPLAIEVLARFCVGRTRDEIEALAQDGDETLRGAFDAEMRQRFLYTRILDRIPAPELRRLASPGLVLRRITPQLIAEVLAEPCGLETPMAPERAERLFDDLAAQVWLVRPGGGGRALEHLPDLRRVMLPQVMADPAAQAVARRAAEWFAGAAAGGAPDARWDELYYRALLDADALPDDPAELRSLADHIGAAALDLPFAAQARLREAAGAVLTLDEIGALTGEARHRAASRRRARQMSEGLERTVLGETPGYMAEALPEPELVQAHFAAGDHAALAELAPRLAADLVGRIVGEDMGALGRFGLDQPAWLAALSTLAPDVPGAARDRLADALDAALTDAAQARLVEALGQFVHLPGTLRAPLAAALLVAAAAGRDLVPGQEEMPFGTVPADTVLLWRCAAAFGDAALPLPVALAVLPLFDPALAAALAAPDSPLHRESSLPPEAASLAGDLTGRYAPVMLGQLIRIESGFERAFVAPRLAELPDDLLPSLVPGRLPEFHAPLRVLLDREEPVAGLAEAVAALARDIPWWPQDLAPALFGPATPGPTLLAALIDVADRCGRLPMLAAALARAPGADPAAVRLSGLIETYADDLRAKARHG